MGHIRFLWNLERIFFAYHRHRGFGRWALWHFATERLRESTYIHDIVYNFHHNEFLGYFTNQNLCFE